MKSTQNKCLVWYSINKRFETQIWVRVSFKSPKAKGYLIKRLGKWYQGDSSELFPIYRRSLHRKGDSFLSNRFVKSLAIICYRKVRKPFYGWLNFPTSQWNIPMYVHTFAIEVSDDHENDDVSDACHRAFTSSFIVITDENKVYHAVLGSRCIRR